MRRLIDSNALLAELDKFANPMPNESGYEFLHGIATAITEIEDAPTVDAVEVVHGRWIHDQVKGNYSPIWFDVMRCSVCKEFIDGSYGTNYCPNCGAKMDGERKDND